MAVVTVADLCRLLPGRLQAIVPEVPPDVEISGVQVSDLPDPAIGLRSGDLLLTLGSSVPSGRQGCRDCVDRLRRAGAAALGVGGVSEPRTPPRLVEACRAVGLPLLEVHTPFLVIGNTYWQLASAAEHRQMSSALRAQVDLVTAAASESGFPVLLNLLANVVGGWVALFDRQAAMVAASQPVPDAVSGDLQERLDRLRKAGNRASATFSTAGQEVVIHALPSPSPMLGYLAVGVERRFTAEDRRTVLTAASLLTLQIARRQRATSAAGEAASSIAYLVDIGELQAARLLASWRGRPLPRSHVRVLVLDRLGGASAVEIVASVWPDRDVIGINEAAGGWCWLTGTDVDRRDLQAALPQRQRNRAIIGPPTELADVGTQRRWLQAELKRQPPGSVVDRAMGPDIQRMIGAPEAQVILAPLLRADQRDNMAAFAGYLRHQGHWESVARDLGIHRNTLRYRVGKAVDLVQADLDDPDQRAKFWLCLRAIGLG